MIMFELSRASFDCLLDHASEALPQLFKQRAKDNESGYVSLSSQVNIFCTEEQAKELLAIAEKDCTGAISAIKTGIRSGDEERLVQKKN
jgi:hypothetical protein